MWYKFMFAVCCKRDSKSLLSKAVLKTEIIINSPISKIPKFIYFPFRWITQLQLKNWNNIFMAVDLLTELLFSVTNSLDILKGIFSKFLCIICVNIVTFFIFQSTVCRFAYIEFADKDSVDNAVSLDDSLFKGRQIKVQFFVLE